MVDIKSKRCRGKDGKCEKYAIYNYPGEKKVLYCNSCKLEKMVNIKCRNCKGNAGRCEKQPNYNYSGEKNALYCFNCKLEDMVNIYSKICIGKEGNCTKQPVYNYSGENNVLYCNNCKLEGMVDIKSKRCGGQGGMCSTIANKKYNGYCTHCFSHMFPDDPLTKKIRWKTKEIAVRDFINKNYEGFIHDKQLETTHCDCTVRRRPDHRKLINNTLLVIETDENQHKSYKEMDEETRYNDLYMAFSGRWVYIRFNPDKYKGNNGSGFW